MSREKLVTPAPVTLEFDQPLIDNAMVAMVADGKALALAEQQHAAHVRAVAASLGYPLPGDSVDPDLIQRDVAVNMRRTAETMLQIGLGLIVLKEACRHGEFGARLEVLRYEPRVAQKYMQVARRFSNAQSTAHLLKAVESQTKLLELIVLDDEQLEEFAITGQTGDLKLDAVATMSVKELRAKVRDLMLGQKADEERVAAHGKLRDEAEERARGFAKLPADKKLEELLKKAGEEVEGALAFINGGFRQALRALVELERREAGIKDFRPLAAGLVGQLQRSLTKLRDELLLTDIVADGVPDWVRGTAHLVDGE